MGIQDRDWYWKDRDQKARAAAASTQNEHKNAPQREPDALIKRVNGKQPPKLWGGDWHWSIQLLVWLCIAVLLLLSWRLIR